MSQNCFFFLQQKGICINLQMSFLLHIHNKISIVFDMPYLSTEGPLFIVYLGLYLCCRSERFTDDEINGQHGAYKLCDGLPFSAVYVGACQINLKW